MRTFQLGTQFLVIFTTGFVFHHLLNRADREAMLTRVREHLAPNGQFIVDIWFLPHTEFTVDPSEEQDWESYVDHHGREVKVSAVERYETLQQRWHQTIYRRWFDTDGRHVTRRTTLTYRYIFTQEMEALLHYNGLRVLSRYGDWERGPLTDKRGCHIYVCTKQ